MSYATDIVRSQASPFAYRSSFVEAHHPESETHYAVRITYTRPITGTVGVRVFRGEFTETSAKASVDIILASLSPRAHRLIRQIEVLALVADRQPVAVVRYYPGLRDGVIAQSWDAEGPYSELLGAFEDLRTVAPSEELVETARPASSGCGFAAAA